MIAKLGLILLMLLFGAALFVLGVLAPESVRRPVVHLIQHIGARGETAPGSPASGVAVAPPSNEKQAGGKQPGQKQPGPAAIPYRDLLIPSPLPPDGTYALELGRFTASTGADALIQRAQLSGIASSTIAVLEDDGTRSFAVVAGRYNSPDEARTARVAVSRALTLLQGLPIVRLPPEPKPATSTAP